MKPLRYPIDLYISDKRQFFAIITMICLIVFGYYLITKNLMAIYWISVLSGVFFIVCGLYFLVLLIMQCYINKPNIRITRYGVVFLTMFKPNNEVTFWYKDLKDIRLDESLGAKNLSVQWTICFCHKDGSYSKRQLIAMTNCGTFLNEKQIFGLIKQSFDGKTPTLPNQPITISDRINGEHIKNNFSWQIKLYGFVIVIVLILNYFK